MPNTVRSKDGTAIATEMVGRGPALVVIHGGARSGRHYAAFAHALSQRFSVVTYDRRGRGASGAQKPGHNLSTELDDLFAVLDATGAERIFGHSAGGIIALEAALRRPLQSLAIYEAPVATKDAFPTTWVPAFEEALREHRHARAFATFAGGLQLLPSWIPQRALELPLHLMLRTADGREMGALMQTLPADIRLLDVMDGTGARYAAIRAPSLVIGGARSPAWLRGAVDGLAQRIPGAFKVVLDGVGHNAPDQEAPALVASHVGAFLAGGLRIAA